MKQAKLLLSQVKMKPSTIHKFRGYVGELFKNYDVIHNHDKNTGKVYYRYPLIQFKTIEKEAAIIAITEKAISVFSEIFMNLEKIEIEDQIIPVHEKNLTVRDVEFGISETPQKYEFQSPWLALNQKNYRKYKSFENMKEKKELLAQTLTGNLLSMSKYLDYHVPEKITVKTWLEPVKVRLKGEEMMAFQGMFETNFHIPDYMGIGKSVSRGYGSVKRVAV